MSEADILVVEDDPELAEVLRLGFEQISHSVKVTHDGGDGLRLAEQGGYRVIVLDVLLPVLDGFQVARELRRRGDSTPILMLTAKDSVADVVRGLDSGAEDYMTKPFSFLELSARIRALIRRTPQPSTRLQVRDLVMNTSTYQVFRGSREMKLTKTEFRLLEVLMRSSGCVVHRRDLVAAVWGPKAWVESNNLDVTMSSLRSTVDKGHSAKLIRTIRGLGYRIDAS